MGQSFFRDVVMGLIVLLFFTCKKDTGTGVGADSGTVYYCSRHLPSASWQVYRKSLSDGKVDTITANPAYNYWWVEPSPDRTQVVMMRSPVGSSPDQFNYATGEMIVANADGTNQHTILADNAFSWVAFGNPHWHPGGNRLLLIAQPTSSSNPFFVATIDINGANPSLLTTQYSLDANWSPQGDKVVFIGIGTTGAVPLNFEVFTADYTYASNRVSNIKQLTNDATRDQDPCFSPDGTAIAFSAGNAAFSDVDLVSIDTKGTNRQTLLDDTGIHGGPLNWSTNGKLYCHSIYLGTTNFVMTSLDPATKRTETLLSAPDYGYISPYYVAR